MDKKRNPFLFLAILLVISCVGVFILGWWVFKLPGWAEVSYGPPARGLDPIQRLVLSVQLLSQKDDLKQPADPSGSARPFTIELGEATSSILGRLEGQGLVTNAGALQDYLAYTGLDTTIQAGEYQLSPRMTAVEIAHILQDATPGEVTFTILPGWRMEEIAEALPTSGLTFSPSAFRLAASSLRPGHPLASALPQGVTLEGFLYPDQYRLPRDATPEALVNLLTENFRLKLSPDLAAGFANQGLSLHQAITLASIVQREAVVAAEMPAIASVFLNRLAAGIKLDADPTVQYAVGYNARQKTWWTNPLSTADLQTDSLYNTYLYPGLPPGPISNPGLDALRAVAYPQQTEFYYFRAACDGSGRHLFARTYAQHVENGCEK
jgi:UPF0755 protein